MKRTQVFNVVVLDRSCSTECIRRAAVDGFNETLAGIRKAQEHYVSPVTFCRGTSQSIYGYGGRGF